MDKIERPTQTITLDDFIEEVLNNPKCKYCKYQEECKNDIGVESLEEVVGPDYGCKAFDNTTDNLLKFFKNNY